MSLTTKDLADKYNVSEESIVLLDTVISALQSNAVNTAQEAAPTAPLNINQYITWGTTLKHAGLGYINVHNYAITLHLTSLAKTLAEEFYRDVKYPIDTYIKVVNQAVLVR